MTLDIKYIGGYDKGKALAKAEEIKNLGLSFLEGDEPPEFIEFVHTLPNTYWANRIVNSLSPISDGDAEDAIGLAWDAFESGDMKVLYGYNLSQSEKAKLEN